MPHARHGHYEYLAIRNALGIRERFSRGGNVQPVLLL